MIRENPFFENSITSKWRIVKNPLKYLTSTSGLVFDFDEIKPGHPGCTSHYECIGNYDRILCHALDAKVAAASVGEIGLLGIALAQTPRDSPSERVDEERNRSDGKFKGSFL